MLGQKIGVSRVEISRIETGKAATNIRRLATISAALGYPILFRFKMKPRRYKVKTKFVKKKKKQ
jgi:transcriptional regulator with XRE-family HTH domain